MENTPNNSDNQFASLDEIIEMYVLTTTDFDALFTRIPKIAKVTLLPGMLRDAYLVIFGEDKFIPAIIPGQKNFVLDAQELETINQILAKSLDLMSKAKIELTYLGTNNAHMLLPLAVQRFFKAKSKNGRTQKPMEGKHIRRSFAHEFGTMPESMYAAWIFFLTKCLVDATMEGATIDALAIMLCMERLSFRIFENRNAILAAIRKDFKTKYSKLHGAYVAGRIDLNADKEILIRDVHEITGVPYTDTKLAQRLLNTLKSE